MKVKEIPIVVGTVGTIPKGSEKGSVKLKKEKRSSGDHPNYSTVEVVQNTEKSPGDLRRLVATQTPEKN